MPTTVSTATNTETCTEFRLKVMIYSPEAGYKFDVTIQKKCFPTKWMLVFNLFKKNGDQFDQLVSVEFEAEKKQEEKALEKISNEGVTVLQGRALRKKVFPLVKAGAESTKIHTEISKAIQQ